MENGDLLVGMKAVEEVEIGVGNLAGGTAAVEIALVEGLANRPIIGKRPIIQVGVRHGVKDGVAEYQQNVSNR